MKNKLVVVMGGKGIGVIAAHVIDELPDMNFLGFLNDGKEITDTEGRFNKLQIIGKSNEVHKLISDTNTFVLLAYKTMKKEKLMWDKLINLNIPIDKFINVFHPTAYIPKDYCDIGRGILMAPYVQLSVDTKISDNCILLANCFIGHDSTLERYVSIANHATVGARVLIERGCHIGTNSTIRQGVNIGEFSIIGVGSVVLHDVPPYSIVAGNPAKVIGTTTKED